MTNWKKNEASLSSSSLSFGRLRTTKMLLQLVLVLGIPCCSNAFIRHAPPVVIPHRGCPITTPPTFARLEQKPCSNAAGERTRTLDRTTTSGKPTPFSVLPDGFLDRALSYSKSWTNNDDGGVFDLGKFKPTGSDKTWLGRAVAYANGMEAKLDEISGWILSYSDLTPDTERTWAGQSFLATNLAYTAAGIYLAQTGDLFFGFVTEITAMVSFAYHYTQLESRGVNNLPSVRLALLIDYICAFFSIGIALFYLASTGGKDIMTVLPPSLLALGTLGASWVWVKGKPYMILHGLWHFFSAYTGYLVGTLHAAATTAM